MNRHKLHVGWRADPNNDHQLKMSAYFHESTDDKKTNHFVSHYITNVHTDTEPYIDMYMSLGTIGMIVNRSAVIMRKPGMIPSSKNTYLKRVFYFGDTFWSGESCLTPEAMKIEFRNQHYDWSGFPERLNQCKYITVNISEFESGDIHTFYAYEEMYGSISDAKAKTDVQYESGHPNPVKQKCIISSGANITFSAGEKIVLSHGFHAKPGSHFVAKIVKKEKYPGYYDEPKKLNLPPLDQSELCNKLPDSMYFAREVNSFEENSLGNSSNNEENFSIYPNPSPGLFTLRFDDGLNTGFALEIRDMMGKVVFKKDRVETGNMSIDIREKPKGIYFVKVLAGGKVYTEKAVVE